MTHRVRSESVLDQWGLVIERGGQHRDRFLRSVVRRVRRARFTDAVIQEQHIQYGRSSEVLEQSLVLLRPKHPDLRCYVSARSLGRHLEVLRLATVEPGLIKRGLATLLQDGAWWTWSVPRGIRQEAEARSFLTVIDRCVADAAQVMATRLGARTRVGTARRNVLDQWE